jgi:hypothetical protein
MPAERCDECGSDGATWTDQRVIDAIDRLGTQ